MTEFLFCQGSMSALRVSADAAHLLVVNIQSCGAAYQASLSSGLTVSGWLESVEVGGGTRTWNCLETRGQPGGGRERELVFSIQPGVHYQLGRVVRSEVNMI